MLVPFEAFSSREAVPKEPVIGRAFARPVGSKTLRLPKSLYKLGKACGKMREKPDIGAESF
jgi:hypothetical protein